MNLVYMLIVASSTATMSEKDVVTTFSKLKPAHEKFLSNTVQYRDEFEAFHENEFIPAVDSMISLLGKGRCKTCLTEYVHALTYQKESADETIGDQLSKIIATYPAQLNKACKKTAKMDLEKNNSWLLDAVDRLEYSKGSKVSKESVGKISSCFPKKDK